MYIAYNPTANLFLGPYKHDHHSLVGQVAEARKFKKQKNARNVIKMLDQRIAEGWVIQDEKMPLPTVQKASGAGMTDIDQCINRIRSMCDEQCKRASARLSDADKELSDAYHYIEFSHFNAADGYKAYRMIQDVLIRRREIKDECRAIYTVNNAIENAMNTLKKTPPAKSFDP